MKKVLKGIVHYIRDADKILWFFVFLTSTYSVMILRGLSNTFTSLGGISTQIISFGLGTVLAIILSKFDYLEMAALWKLYLPISYLAVAALELWGVQREGTDNINWFILDLPNGYQLSIQPTEILKIAFILAFAYHLYSLGDRLNHPLYLLGVLLHGAFPVLLIHYFGDDGTALVFACIFVGMLFAAGLAWRYVFAGIVAAGVLIPVAWYTGIISNYQKQRILVIFTSYTMEDIEWQQDQAIMAIGSGQLWGSGLYSGDHMRVPEIQNDFILAFIGQALGFVGCAAVVALIAVICIKILMVCRVSTTTLGAYICMGVFMMLASQSIINIGMNLKLLPVIGITLPFFSKGGSSILSVFMGIGLVQSVYMHSKVGLFGATRL